MTRLSLFPALMAESYREVTPQWLKARGFAAVIFDIDNTLVPHGQEATPEVTAYFSALHEAGIRTFLISNNSEERVKPFAEAVSSGFVCKADKPSRKRFRTAMAQMGSSSGDTLAVGDQLFTDVLGANRSGLTSLLVQPVEPLDPPGVAWKRFFEKILLFFVNKSEKQLKSPEE